MSNKMSNKLTSDNIFNNPIPVINTLTSLNAQEGDAPNHQKKIRSQQQTIWGITCPCGAGCAYNNDKKAQQLWIKLHLRVCPLKSTLKKGSENIKHFISK